MSNAECCNVLNDTFAKSFSVCCVDTEPHMRKEDLFPMDPLVDFAGIVKFIQDLKLSSSCGADEINSKFLKNTAVYSSIFLCTFSPNLLSAQLCLQTGRWGRWSLCWNQVTRILLSITDPFQLPASLAKSLNASYFPILSHFWSPTLSSLHLSMGFAKTTLAKRN